MYGCNEEDIAHYYCHKISEKITINGRLNKAVWLKAPKASLVDLVTGEPAFLKTQIASLWDVKNLYVAFWIDETNIQANFTERDSQIYFENDVELFIDGKDCYYEFQINALGTIYEVFYIWQDAYKKGSRFDTSEFDLLTRNVDILGGFQDLSRYKKHPRGKRWAIMDWDFPNLQSGVQIQGTINDSSDQDSGWTVELAFPWEGMKSLFGELFKPKIDDILRINFSRFQALQYNGIKSNYHPGWSLNPHKVYDSHIPHCFSYVHLTEQFS
ncbi:MAG: carbohydrate-binding family 9-like protein [Candidatus Thorarchaeota archaeon]